jgi:hypothetical protein
VPTAALDGSTRSGGAQISAACSKPRAWGAPSVW